MPDVYDEEFHAYMGIAKRLMTKLRDVNDIRICRRWITKLCNLNSDDVMVKKNRNHFFKYMLHVLHDGVLEGPFQELPTNDLHSTSEQKARVCLCGGERHWKGKGDREEYSVDKEARKAPYMTHWSPDKRTYVAAKALPGAGALIYMAVAKDPNQGWDIPKR